MKRILFLVLLIIFLKQVIFPGNDFSGYFENRFFLIYSFQNAGISGDELATGDYNRLRLKLKATPSEKVRINLAVDFYSFHGVIMAPAGVSTDPDIDDPGQPGVKIDLDRIYADISFKHFDLSVGKQRIAMGVSYVWAPLDIFNRINIMEPKEEKPGVNAVKIYIPVGNRSSFTTVYIPDNNFGSAVKAIRFTGAVLNIDLGFTYVNGYEKTPSIFGLDLRGENLVGWWIECGYFDSLLNDQLKLVLGMDYTFPVGTGLYWLNEYFYDSGGEKDHSIYDYNMVSNGERFTLGRNYLFSMLRYGMSEFASVSISYIGNLDDGSILLNPAVSYEIFQNVSITSGLYIPAGRSGGELNNQKRGALFLWLKINF